HEQRDQQGQQQPAEQRQSEGGGAGGDGRNPQHRELQRVRHRRVEQFRRNDSAWRQRRGKEQRVVRRVQQRGGDEGNRSRQQEQKQKIEYLIDRLRQDAGRGHQVEDEQDGPVGQAEEADAQQAQAQRQRRVSPQRIPHDIARAEQPDLHQQEEHSLFL